MMLTINLSLFDLFISVLIVEKITDGERSSVDVDKKLMTDEIRLLR